MHDLAHVDLAPCGPDDLAELSDRSGDASDLGILMHVQLASPTGGLEWHRHAAGSNSAVTACGRSITAADRLGLRYEVLDGDLCAGCFTPYELRQAAARAAANATQARAERDAYDRTVSERSERAERSKKGP